MTTLAGLPIKNTRDLFTPDTRMAMLLYAPNKFGKTTVAAGLDAVTRKYYGKPTIIVAIEAGEGGGTMSVQDLGVPYVIPRTKEEFDAVIAALETDTKFGGVVVDSATEYVNRFLKPWALDFPSREAGKTGVVLPQRKAGVPEQSDYQTMGEQARARFNQIIGLTTLTKQDGTPDMDRRKHVIITALERVKEDRKGNLLWIGPDLPGAMASTAAAMFQQVGYIQVIPKVVPDPNNPKQTIRVNDRALCTQADGVRFAGDRFNVFPGMCETYLMVCWEKYWMPKLEQVQKQRKEQQQ